MQHRESLNEAQKQAVVYTDGPLRIIAGAGAGKTRTLTHRIFHLVDQGVPAEQILAITFTNKAAAEMQERVEALLKDSRDTQSPFVSTFHALGVFLLRQFGERVDVPTHFTILDRKQSIRAVKRATESAQLDPKQWKPKKTQSVISRKKGEGISVEAFNPSDHYSQTVRKIWQAYETILTEEKSLDFDDLLLRPMQLLSRHEDIRKRCQERWHFVHVDEYQDTNRVQYQIAKHIAAPQNNLCVVGDSDQTIYTWRGATIQNILNFEQDYPEAETVRLERNYRSTKTILEAAHEIISQNSLRNEKKLFTDNQEGDPIELFVGYTEADEAGRVVKRVKSLIRSGVDPEEIAVLYRTNFQSRALEDAFLTQNLPYHLVGTRFFDRKEVRYALSYIRLALNQDSVSDLRRIINTPRRGIGKKTLERILTGRKDEISARRKERIDAFWNIISQIEAATKTKNPSEVVKITLEQSGLLTTLKEDGGEEAKERIANLKELVSLATRYDSTEEGIQKFIENAALMSDQDSLRSGNSGVRLMTIHAAKGLEFEYVFITGLEQGLFPQDKEGATAEEKEEERRLMYVALTRAKERAFLSYAETRRIYGSKTVNLPSEFLDDIPDSLLEHDRDLSSTEDTIELLDI